MITCSNRARAAGGVLLLDGTNLSALEGDLRQATGVTYLTQGVKEEAPVQMARAGAKVAIDVNAAHPSLLKAIQAKDVMSARVFLYASPWEIAVQSQDPEKVIKKLQDFTRTTRWTLDRKEGVLGVFRRQQLRRLIERLQQKAPAGSPTIEQYHALEQHMRTVLGLDVHPTVYLAPRSPADVVLPASKVHRLHKAAQHFAYGGTAAATCDKYSIVQNGVNVTTVPMQDASTLKELRTALASRASAEGLMFLYPNKFPVSSSDEATTPVTEALKGCKVVMVSTKQKAGPRLVANPNPVGGSDEADDTADAADDATTVDPMKTAADLTVNAWKKVFQQASLQRGWLIGPSGPFPARGNTFQFTEQLPNYSVTDQAKTNAFLTQTLDTATSVAVGNESSGVNLGIFSTKKTKTTTDTTSTSTGKSQKVSSWLFPRATLWPGWTVQPTSDFLSKINAVTNQVTSNNSEAEAQAMALKKLFLEYGDQYPSKVTLGGKAYAIEESEQQADFSSTSVVETSSSGFNLLFVSASKSSGDDSYNSSYSASANASSKINTIGGNTLLGGNAAQWIPSIEPCETWRIISFQDWVPVATFLPAETKKAVERIMNSSAWTAATAQDAAAAKQAATQGPK